MQTKTMLILENLDHQKYSKNFLLSLFDEHLEK